MKYKQSTIETITSLLSQAFPSGQCFKKKNDIDSNFYKLLRGLGSTYTWMANVIEDYVNNEINIYTCDKNLDRWEKSVSMPDDCMFGYGDKEKIRKEIVLRFRKKRTQTLADFNEVLSWLGISATISQIYPTFVYTLPILLYDATSVGLIKITYTGDKDDEFSFLKCLFDGILPAYLSFLIEKG